MKKLSLLKKSMTTAGVCMFVFFAVLLIANACKKEINQQPVDSSAQQKASTTGSASATTLPYCWEDAENGLAYDSILKPTILGARLIGLPYSVATMQQASRNLTGSSIGITEINGMYGLNPPAPAS